MPSCSLPGNRYGHRPARSPIWPCTGRGLPCRRRYRRVRGAPLPHRFALTASARTLRHGGGMFSVALFLPSGRPALQLAGALARRCSDFPLPNARSTRWAAAARPPRLLITVTPAGAAIPTRRHPVSTRMHHDRRIITCNRDMINQRMHRVAGSAPIDICRQV